jgi:hypothetical protein
MWRPLPYLGQENRPAGPRHRRPDLPVGPAPDRPAQATYPALRRGDAKVIYSTAHTGDEPDAGIFAFERTGGDAGDNYALRSLGIVIPPIAGAVLVPAGAVVQGI